MVQLHFSINPWRAGSAPFSGIPNIHLTRNPQSGMRCDFSSPNFLFKAKLAGCLGYFLAGFRMPPRMETSLLWATFHCLTIPAVEKFAAFCAHCFLPFRWVILRRVWLHHLYFLIRYLYIFRHSYTRSALLKFLSFTLNNLSSVNLSLYVRYSSPLFIFVILHWILSRMSTSLLSWWAQTLVENAWYLTTAVQRRRITSFHLLAMFSLL